MQSALIERFWSKVKKTDACWLWQRQLNNKGYGCFSVHGRLCYAHRFSWSLANGPIPQGMKVLHRCDTPACVNPDHLWIGTQRDNMQDCKQKGRVSKTRGIAHSRARLTEADVYAIRTDSRSLAAIGRTYGITRGAVNNIKRRRIWKHLP